MCCYAGAVSGNESLGTRMRKVGGFTKKQKVGGFPILGKNVKIKINEKLSSVTVK